MRATRFVYTLVAFIKMWLLCICAAVVYGILHDQITVRVSPEYFTIGHPPVFNTTSPTLLALGWGIIATWWVGALLGFTTAVIALVGQYQKLSASNLVRPIGFLFAAVASMAILFGIIGFVLAATGMVTLPERDIAMLPAKDALGYIAAGWAHNTSYATGVVGAIVLWLWIWRERKQLSQTTVAPSSGKRFTRGVVIGGIICSVLWGGGLYFGYITYQGFIDTYFPVDGTF